MVVGFQCPVCCCLGWVLDAGSNYCRRKYLYYSSVLADFHFSSHQRSLQLIVWKDSVSRLTVEIIISIPITLAHHADNYPRHPWVSSESLNDALSDRALKTNHPSLDNICCNCPRSLRYLGKRPKTRENSVAIRICCILWRRRTCLRVRRYCSMLYWSLARDHNARHGWTCNPIHTCWRNCMFKKKILIWEPVADPVALRH